MSACERSGTTHAQPEKGSKGTTLDQCEAWLGSREDTARTRGDSCTERIRSALNVSGLTPALLGGAAEVHDLLL